MVSNVSLHKTSGGLIPKYLHLATHCTKKTKVVSVLRSPFHFKTAQIHRENTQLYEYVRIDSSAPLSTFRDSDLPVQSLGGSVIIGL